MLHYLPILSGSITPLVVNSFEVHRLTGLTQEQARDWRRRGFLKKGGPGNASYDVFDLAEISLRRGLNQLGVPLAEAGPLVLDASSYVVADICRRTFVSVPNCEDLLSEIHHILAESESFLLVTHRGDGQTDARIVDPKVVSSGLMESEAKFGPVWGVINLQLVASLLFDKSRKPLVERMSVEAQKSRDRALMLFHLGELDSDDTQ